MFSLSIVGDNLHSRPRALSCVLIVLLCLPLFLLQQTRAASGGGGGGGGGSSSSSSSNNAAYETINEYLAQKLAKSPELSLDDLMKSARDWLHANRKREHTKALIKFKFNGREGAPNDAAVEQALRQLTGLRKNLKELKCDSESQRLREANNDLVGQKGFKAELVRDIVLHYDRRHALACQREYPKRFASQLRTFDSIKRWRIETMLDGAIQGYLLSADEKFLYLATGGARSEAKSLLQQLKDGAIRQRLYLKFVLGVKGMRPSSGSDPHLLYNGIKTLLATPLANNDEPLAVHVRKTNQGGLPMSREIAMELFKRFLLEPCDSFVKHFGANLFVPARYDAVRLVKQQSPVLQLADPNLSQFYLSWAHFSLCYAFLDDKQYRLASAQRIGQIAEQEANEHARRG